MKKTKKGETKMLRRNGPVTKSVESVQRPEESQRLERLVQGFEPEMKA